MAKLISKTYGEALFELSVEESKTDLFLEEIQVLLDAFAENPDFYRLMTHPQVTKEEKVSIMGAVLDGRVSGELSAFFRLIIEKDRYGEITEILTYFVDRMKEFKGIGVAYVTTPTELTDAQKKAVEDKLLQTTRFNRMEMHYELDEALIGGMTIRIGDRVVDSSISNQLNQLKKQLMNIQLA